MTVAGHSARGSDEIAMAASLGALSTYTIVLAAIVRSRRPVAILLPLGPLVVASLFALPILLFVDRVPYAPVANLQFLAGAVLLGAFTRIPRGRERRPGKGTYE